MNQKKASIAVFFIVATELIGFGLIIPVLPQISASFATSGVWLGVLLSAYSFAQFFSAPILGQLSDRYGRKPLLILSKIGTIASYLILAQANSYALLLISRLIDGFTGGNIAVARAFLSDITAPEKRSRAMAIIGVAFGTGFIFGPAIGAYCYQWSNNFSVAGYIGALLSLGSLFLTLFLIREPNAKNETRHVGISRNVFKLPMPVRYLLLISFVSMCLFSGFESSFSVFTENKFQFNESQNSMLFLVIGICAFFVQGSFTKIAIKPIQKAIRLALFCMGLGLLLTNIIQGVILSLAVLVFLIFGVAILNTHIPAELSAISNDKGYMMGLYESSSSLARIVGPLIIFSTLFNHINTIYLNLSIIAFGCLLFSMFFAKQLFKIDSTVN